MNTDARTFIDALFARCSPSSFLTLTALPPTPNLPRPSRHIRVDDATALSNALERLEAANRLGWSGVVGIGTRSVNIGRWRRGGKSDLAELPALFMDIDRSGDDSQTKRDTFPLLPSIQVCSGGAGCEHWYWLLECPTHDLMMADRALRGLAQWLGGDPIMTIAHSLRLPGTKNPKHNALCHVIELHPERRYSLAQFEPYLADPPLRLRTEGILSAQTAAKRASAVPLRKRRELIQAVEACLRADFGGFYKANGWLSALCPCGHSHDKPGQHFGFLPGSALGFCFGRHGRLSLEDLCVQLRLVN
ncbi:MAG: hypothetical protein ACYDBJ_20280 [Aggregatilineales bacterium]